ncbi:MAG: hypothetical protein AAGD32_01715 [Planctomycetota bacterium]
MLTTLSFVRPFAAPLLVTINASGDSRSSYQVVARHGVAWWIAEHHERTVIAPDTIPPLRRSIAKRNPVTTALTDPVHLTRAGFGVDTWKSTGKTTVASSVVGIENDIDGDGHIRFTQLEQSTTIRVPLTLLLLVSLSSNVLLAAMASRGRPQPGNCPACGYDLRATPGRCSECGWGRKGEAAAHETRP